MLPIHCAIIRNRYATLIELKSVYYYEDVLDFFELIAVDTYNEVTSHRLQEAKNKLRDK